VASAAHYTSRPGPLGFFLRRLRRCAFPVLIAILWGAPALCQVDPIGACFRYTVDPIFNLLVPRKRQAAAPTPREIDMLTIEIQ